MSVPDRRDKTPERSGFWTRFAIPSCAGVVLLGSMLGIVGGGSRVAGGSRLVQAVTLAGLAGLAGAFSPVTAAGLSACFATQAKSLLPSLPSLPFFLLHALPPSQHSPTNHSDPHGHGRQYTVWGNQVIGNRDMIARQAGIPTQHSLSLDAGWSSVSSDGRRLKGGSPANRDQTAAAAGATAGPGRLSQTLGNSACQSRKCIFN
jgi:hypothetical protein